MTETSRIPGEVEPPSARGTPGTPAGPDAAARATADALLLGCAGASLGYLGAYLALPFSHEALGTANSLDGAARRAFFLVVAAAGVAGALLALFLHLRARRAPDPDAARERLASGLRRLRPLLFAWLLPLVLDTELWASRPLLMFLLAFSALLASVRGQSIRARLPELPGAAAWLLLAAAMAGYAAYAAYYTILAHRQLATSAYDLGIMENVLWNTTRGRFFASSLEGGSHLGVHTSFIFLLLLPPYGLWPRPETLLVIQAVVFALGAWPLFLIARELLAGRTAALVASLLYLLHPAVQGANFYDFHELAFAPPLFFLAFYLWLRRSRLLWLAVLLLLTVKEDLSLVVLLLGAYSFASRRRAEGLALATTGVVSYFALQHVVIPHFASGGHDYAWYYEDLIPPGEGPFGLLRTLVVNPVFSLAHALTAKKLLYLAQVLGPLAFLPLLGVGGPLLMAYGLLAALLASREPLFSLGFQYALLLVPQAFVAALVHGAALPPRRRRQAAVVVLGMSFLVAWHHGMLYPRKHFTAGFHRVDFVLSDAERARAAEVEEIARKLEPRLSITASETIVPHVARRPAVQTLRYADRSPFRSYDIFFLLREDVNDSTRARFPEVFNGIDYVLVFEGDHTAVYVRARPVAGGA